MAVHYIFVFNSKSQAIYMESRLKEKGYSLELRPTPRKLAKSCSYSLVVSGDLPLIKGIRDCIVKSNVSLKGVYRVTGSGRTKTYKKIF